MKLQTTLIRGLTKCPHNMRYLSVSKVFESSRDAVKDIKNGASICFGGFGQCGREKPIISNSNTL